MEAVRRSDELSAMAESAHRRRPALGKKEKAGEVKNET